MKTKIHKFIGYAYGFVAVGACGAYPLFFGAKRQPRVVRSWNQVTCKHCLKRHQMKSP